MLWAGENSLRRVLGAAINADAQRNRTGGEPENQEPVRRLAPDIARTHPGKDAMHGKPKKAVWQNEYLLDPVRSAVKLKETKKFLIFKSDCPEIASFLAGQIRSACVN